MLLIQSQFKVQKTPELKYLEANKQQTQYRLIYLECSKLQKGYDCRFQDQRNA